MPPVPRKPPPDPTGEAAAAVAAASAPFVGAAVTPGMAGLQAAQLTAAAAAKLAKTLIDAFLAFARRRGEEFIPLVMQTVAARYSDRPYAELRRAVDKEHEYEREFVRKIRERLARDVPKALAITDPALREEALRAIFDRERRYLHQREAAMLSRVVSRLEAAMLKEDSPEGAYWKLSPDVKEHTLDCLAMGEKFWPWGVLDEIHPPLHAGCPCVLLSLDDAVQMGLMTRDQIPDPGDAMRLARRLMKEAEEGMQEGVTQEVISAYLSELEEARRRRGSVALGALAALAALDGGTRAQTERAVADATPRAIIRGDDRKRHSLRWEAGEKGGEFRPTRGGSPGGVRGRALSARGAARLRSLVPDVPVPPSMNDRARWTWVGGTYTRIPEAREWEKRIGSRTYRSPAGSTNLYRDGRLIDEPGAVGPADERRQVRVRAGRQRDERIEREMEERRAARRARFVERAASAGQKPHPDRPPVERGDGPEALLSLEQAGFRLMRMSTGGTGAQLTFGHEATDARLDATWDGAKVADVEWEATPPPLPNRDAATGIPASWAEFRGDALAWADELGERFGARVQLPDIRVDENLGDHAGTHLWSGDALVGVDTGADITRAGAARAKERKLTDDERRGVWSSYWVTAHEIGHGVNPIAPRDFVGATANLEEALTEEAAHVLAVERLEMQGQSDVLDWRGRNPQHIAVGGVYRQERHALAELLDAAGVEDAFERRNLIFDLKFRTAPNERINVLGARLHAHDSSKSLAEWQQHVRLVMLNRAVVEGARARTAVPFEATTPALRGASGFGRFRGRGELSEDGLTLTLDDGEVWRVEHLPVPDEVDEEGVALRDLTDGTAIVRYPSGARREDGPPREVRWIDTQSRARLLLRGFVGKGSPGDFGLKELYEPGDSTTDLVRKLGGERGFVTIRGVPVKRRYDEQTFGVGHAGHDGRHLSGVMGERNAVEVALTRAEDAPRWPARRERLSPGLFDDVHDPWGDAPDDPPPVKQGSWLKSLFKKPPSLFGHALEDGPNVGPAKTKGGSPPKPPKPPKPQVIGGKGKPPAKQGIIRSYEHQRLELGKAAGGSNGARWGFDEDGNRWLVKSYRGNVDRVATELLANRVYAEMGAHVAPAGTIDVDGKTALTYKALDGEVRDRTFQKNGPDERVGAHYMTDALLANWDFVGLTDDNILWSPEGEPFRIDQGGTFEYRAMGQPKPFGPVPTEVWTMIRKGQGKRASKVDEAGMRAQARDIAKRLTPARVDALVDAAPFEDEAMRERIRGALKARIGWMARFANGDEDLPEPQAGDAARAVLKDAQKKLFLRPDQYDALGFLLDEGDIQRDLRAGKGREEVSEQVAEGIRSLDSLLRATKTPDEVYAFRGLSMDAERAASPDLGGLVGKTLEERAFSTLSLNEEEARAQPVVMRVLVPAKSSALYVGGVPDFESQEGDPDLLLPRRARLKILGRSEKGGKVYVDVAYVGQGFGEPAKGPPKGPPKPPPPKPPAPPASPGTTDVPSALSDVIAAYRKRGEVHAIDAWDDTPYIVPLSELESEQGAQDRCDDVTSCFAKFARSRGLPSKMSKARPPSTWFDVDDDNYLTGHRVVLVRLGGRIYEVDWTARQYDPTADFPVVRDVTAPPAPPASPGTIVAPPATVPDIPQFHTPDKSARKANIAAAKELRALAQAGDLAGLQGYEVHPKAAKVAAYRDSLVALLKGDVPTPPPKQPKPKPKAPKPAAPAGPPPAEIVAAEAQLEQMGVEFVGMTGGDLLSDSAWGNVITRVAEESAALEARWPGIMKGRKLSRKRPKSTALGVYDLHKKDIRLRPHSGHGTHKNKYGMPFGVTQEVGGTFRHELAHALDYATNAIHRDALKQTDFRDENGNPLTTPQWAKRNVSDYAGTMTSESIAEMFALYTDASYEPGRLPPRVEAIMESLATGGTPPPPEKHVDPSKLGDKDLGIKVKG